MGTFFGDLLYDRTVPADHFLRQLERVVDWGEFTEQLIELYRGKGRLGRPPYDPAVILKMLVISYLHDISERMTETHVNENLPAKWFVGLAGDEQAPDHSTLTGFKRRIIGVNFRPSWDQQFSAIVNHLWERRRGDPWAKNGRRNLVTWPLRWVPPTSALGLGSWRR